MTTSETEYALQNALAPISSPWGQVQQATLVTPGVWRVSTASHGGLMVERTLNACIPEPWREADGCYEEDEAWCLPWSFLRLPVPAHWKGIDYATSTLRDDYPDAYEQLHQVKLLPGDSRSRDQQAFHDAHRGELQVTCAFGDWKAGVPRGMVGVIACPAGQEATAEQRTQTRYFLVETAVYQERRRAGRFRVLIDEAFQETSAFA